MPLTPGEQEALRDLVEDTFFDLLGDIIHGRKEIFLETHHFDGAGGNCSAERAFRSATHIRIGTTGK